MSQILCIGHAAFDLTYISGNFIEENKKYETDCFTECCGGPAANAAYLLSRWGVKTSFAGAVGNDLYGNKVIEDFKKAGTGISLLRQYSAKTHLSFIIINGKNGSRTIINRKDKNLIYGIDIKALKKIKPSVILTDGHEPEASLKAMKLFPKAASILDAGSLREGTRILADRVNYLAASRDFALALSGIKSLNSRENMEECLEFLCGINRNSIITMGDNGLIYHKNNKVVHMRAFPADPVDTTGAGDIFHGAFAYGIYMKLPINDILKLASAAAALSVEKTGGRTSIPELSAVFKRAGLNC